MIRVGAFTYTDFLIGKRQAFAPSSFLDNRNKCKYFYIRLVLSQHFSIARKGAQAWFRLGVRQIDPQARWNDQSASFDAISPQDCWNSQPSVEEDDV